MGLFSLEKTLLLKTTMSKAHFAYSETRDEDLALMLASKTYLGTHNCSTKMKNYVYTRNKEGIYYLNIAKTWEKLMIAARVIAAIDNHKDVLVISSRQYAQRAILKYATYTGANYFVGKWTPGTLTNQNTKKFQEPRLIIVCDPRLDHQCLNEASYMNIPVIALCDTDSPLNWVDVAIPANNKSIFSLAYTIWLLTREVLQIKSEIPRDSEWDVMVDLFMYRDPDATKEAEKVEAPEEGEAEENAEPEAVVENAQNAFAAGEDEDGEGDEGDDVADFSAPAQNTETADYAK